MERLRTVRAAIRDELLRGPATARDLSERVSIREKDVAGHLEHLQKSLQARGERLVVVPASCIGCGCLSLKTCGLLNTGDRAAERGSGARYLLGDSPEEEA